MKGDQFARIGTLANEQNADHEKNGSDQVGQTIDPVSPLSVIRDHGSLSRSENKK